MSVFVDTVYQRVLALANKEQRGYITPQEFNLLANQAQLAIFEQYFHDESALMMEHGNDTVHSDQLSIIKEKIALFERTAVLSGGTTLPSDLYRLSGVYSNTSGILRPAEKISLKELDQRRQTKLSGPTADHPIYTQAGSGIKVYSKASPTVSTILTASVSCHYLKRPADVIWGYVIVNEQAMYDSGQTTNFELHQSEETNLVIKILELAGIVLNKPGLVQLAGQEEVHIEAIQKQ